MCVCVCVCVCVYVCVRVHVCVCACVHAELTNSSPVLVVERCSETSSRSHAPELSSRSESEMSCVQPA